MPFKKKLLVVANRTADSDDLIAVLKQRASDGGAAITLLAPATPTADAPGRAAARERAQAQVANAVKRYREAGLEVEAELVGDADPVDAVAEIWDHGKFDEVIVSTLASGSSKWLGIDVPQRVEKITGGARVSHVVSTERRPSPAPSPPKRRIARLAEAFLPDRWADPRK